LALTAGAVLAPPGTPLGGWLTRRIEFPGMSRRNTSVSGFWSAFFGSILYSIVSWLLSALVFGQRNLG